MTAGPSCFAAPTSDRLQWAKSGDGEVRKMHRVIGAAILACGLALSVSVHPGQRGRELVDELMAGGSGSSDVPSAVGSVSFSAMSTDFSFVELADLVSLVDFADRHPEVSTGALVGLVHEFGAKSVARSIELLASVDRLRSPVPGVPYGGGGYSTNLVDWDALQSLVTALTLLGSDGTFRGQALVEALRSVLTDLAGVVGGTSASPSPPPSPTQLSLVTVPSPVAPSTVSTLLVADPPPNSAPDGPSPTADEQASVLTPEPEPIETVLPSTVSTTPPAETTSSVVIESSVVPQPTTEVSSPEPTNVTPSQTNPSMPQPTSGSGAGDGTAGTANSGPSSSSSESAGGSDSADNTSSGSGSAGGSSGSGASDGGSSSGD